MNTVSSPERNVAQATGASAPLQAAPADAQAFLMFEADLLDSRSFDAWLELYTADAIYWVPAEHGESDPSRRVSLFYDDRSILEDRIWRLGHPKMFSQNPPARQVRVLSTPLVEEASGDRLRLRTKFIMFEHRLREQRTFGGTYQHVLAKQNDTWKIQRKVVHLVNCDTVLWNIGVPI
ncbi:MAG: aromatic-ring-hydroxylating dioxygenase subunit beta [Pigmentiphaga sp.]|uniref:aromatic-ring-hydroxylating dioxygenase subunit beta n=1 Tax=Pigmentiphaga sp. TaxID=1977564 RepID=UPI0029BCB3DD|nr:aromatic-ring-hydroxylating dioxygenase subunit beta [Pigmentiphaga sp.]MDX3907414.1 aromatic-ring-hydroxylating dioxygenase subunit beta [Pigmentiphaga sp.]